jgi:hypothetical protein
MRKWLFCEEGSHPVPRLMPCFLASYPKQLRMSTRDLSLLQECFKFLPRPYDTGIYLPDQKITLGINNEL